MNFTKNMILEVLRPYRGKNYMAKEDDRTFRWVAMLPTEKDAMEPDMLYVCYLSEALKRRSETAGFYYICIQDRFFGDEEEDSSAKLRGTIVINENKEVSWLLNIVQERLLQISEWMLNMQSALVGECDYQKLIDLCEPILNNFVSVLDSSYKLLAYTKNILSDDPINVSLVDKGYHTEETIKLLQKNRRFKFYDESENLYTTSAGAISRYETVGKWCRSGGTPLLHVVMVCSRTPLNSGMVDLFDMLMDAINVCFQREQQNPNIVQPYSSLLLDILYNDLDNPVIIAERAKSANIPMAGSYNVFRIVFEDNAIVLVSRVFQELLSLMPGSRIISHQYEIVALNIYPKGNVSESTEKIASLIRPVLDKYRAVCGVSAEFHKLPELKIAYIQASRAEFVGSRLRDLGNYWNFDKGLWEQIAPPSERQIFNYDDMYIHFMLYKSKHNMYDVFVNNYYNKALQKLVDYDKEHNSNLVQILYIYLLSERRATAAGKLLHMHRNNILYHIANIEEMLGIDLSDHMTRLKMILTFCLSEIGDAELT